MEEGSTHVQAFMMLSEQDIRAGYVREQTDDGDKKHPVRFHRGRILEPMVRLIKYIQRDQDQENAIEQCGENLDTVKPVSLSRSGAPGCKTHRDDTEAQRRPSRRRV